MAKTKRIKFKSKKSKRITHGGADGMGNNLTTNPINPGSNAGKPSNPKKTSKSYSRLFGEKLGNLQFHLQHGWKSISPGYDDQLNRIQALNSLKFNRSNELAYRNLNLSDKDTKIINKLLKIKSNNVDDLRDLLNQLRLKIVNENVNIDVLPLLEYIENNLHKKERFAQLLINPQLRRNIYELMGLKSSD